MAGLVDGLAKLAAAEGAAPKETIRLIDSAEALVRHAAAPVAVATHNANNHKTAKIKEDGTVVSVTRRDDQDALRDSKARQLQPLKANGATATTPPPAADADAMDSALDDGDQADDASTGSTSEHLSKVRSKRRLQRSLKKLAKAE